MRENRLYGSEGGVARAIPTPIRSCARRPIGCVGRDGETGLCAKVEQRNSDVPSQAQRARYSSPPATGVKLGYAVDRAEERT